MVEVGSPPPTGGGIDKRTLLIGAVLIGGTIGAFMLFSRKSQPSDAAENKAQTSAGNSASDLAYQNLATQLLGFRGDVSVANAKLDQGEQDIISLLGEASAQRAASDNFLGSSIAALNTQIGAANVSLSVLGGADPSIGEQFLELHPELNPPASTTNGAGGATPRDAILAAFGAEDDGGYYTARMSAGPVRQLTNRSY